MPQPDQLAGDLTLRAPVEGDMAALTAITNLPGVRAGTLRPPFGTEGWVRKRILDERPGLHVIVAAVRGEAVGWLWLDCSTGRKAHVAELAIAIHDDFVGRRIGSALVAAGLDLADNWLGLRRLHLETYPDNVRAIALYEKSGFEREGILRGDTLRDGVLQDTLVMGRLRPAPPFADHAR